MVLLGWLWAACHQFSVWSLWVRFPLARGLVACVTAHCLLLPYQPHFTSNAFILYAFFRVTKEKKSAALKQEILNHVG